MKPKEHKCPQRIVKLFKDEHTAMTEGRQAILGWVDRLHITPGDIIIIPEVGGRWKRFTQITTPKEKVN